MTKVDHERKRERWLPKFKKVMMAELGSQVRNNPNGTTFRTPIGHFLEVILGADSVSIEWRDRAGIGEGWVQHSLSYTQYGFSRFKVILRSLRY